MADFLSALGNQISSQFLGGELSADQRTLSGKLNGKQNNFAKLGDFAKRIDQSAQRNYLEEGYLNNNYGDSAAKMMRILTQEPTATVLVKKKMYSSLAKNFAPEYMSEEEKITFLAMDKLFYNKCKKIAAYEKLCKIQLASQKTGEIDEQIIPIIVGLSDMLMSLPTESSGSFGFGAFGDVIRKIKSVYDYSVPSFYTDWIEDAVTPYALKYGYGTGVIELTNFTSINTNCNVSGSEASCNINLEDPYEIMTVTPADIEQAISDAVNINNSVLNKLSGLSPSFDTKNPADVAAVKVGKLNQIRRARGASEISFKVNPNTVYGRRLIAIVDALGQEIPFEPDPFRMGNADVAAPYLLGGEVLGDQGLSTKKTKGKAVGTENVKSLINFSELNLFSDAVNSYYIQIGLEQNTVRNYDFAFGSDLMNYIRRKLTFYFAGKNIIQPMDTINVYISSRTKEDNKLISGIQNAFTGFGLFQNFSNTISDIKGGWNALFSPSMNLNYEMEKSAFIGNTKFPNYFWNMLRTQFTSEKEGCHVYAGVISDVSSSYSGGAFSVNITAKDNTFYLSQGTVNFNPGTVDSSGAFYDPLTPYKTSFDSVYALNSNQEFLDENNELLKSGLLNFTYGPNAGQTANLNNINCEIEYAKADYAKLGKKIVFAPDGLVYKWKEGIGVLNLAGPSNEIIKEEYYGAQSAAKDVLANQDIMNTISLLVTGIPYNYANFFTAGREAGTLLISKDKNSLAKSRLTQLTQGIKKNNALWGGFVPFKNLNMDEKSYMEMISLRTQNLVIAQANLQENYKLLQQLQSEIILSSLGNNSSEYNPSATMEKYKNAIKEATSVVQDQEDNFQKKLGSSNFTIIGDDISTDYDYYFSNGANYSDPDSRRLLRNKVNFLTRRTSWSVRSNRDVNYFIVDDTYDKNYDLLAFQADFKNQQFNSYNDEYMSVIEKIKAAASILDLEFFADTQGHLRVRAPQYNRIPSSVFYTMLKNKNSKKNIQIYPQFLNDLYFDQIQTMYNRITAIEDELRLLCLLSQQGNSKETDGPAIQFIRSSSTNVSGSPISNNNSKGKNDFKFLSNPSNGQIENFGDIYSYPDVNQVVNPDRTTRDDNFSKTILLNNKLESQINIKTTFDLSGRLKTFIKNFGNLQQTSIQNTDFLNELIGRIYNKTGIKFKIQDYIFSNYYGNNSEIGSNTVGQVTYPKFYQVDSFKVTNEMALRIAERQKVIKNLFSVIKNAYEINSLNDQETATQLLFPSSSISKNKKIPEVFEYMIEDEANDDYGPGSGSRFVIQNHQIISYSIREQKPDYTAINVTGRIDKYLAANDAGGESNLPKNANSMVSSSAIDYDLWKMYGLIFPANIDKPFLTNPQSQTGPFAAALLTRQRKKIIGGTLTIIGNEYMQPGEVIYLEQKGMLFYVESVSHKVSMGDSFTTDLTLSYGHYPGEYIPTTLDIAGRMIYNNRDKITVDNRKNLNVVSGNPIGCFVLDPPILNSKGKNENISESDFNSKLMTGKTPMGQNNSEILTNIATVFKQELNANNDPNFDLELRLVYYTGNIYQNKTKEFASYIKNVLSSGASTSADILDPSLSNFGNKVKTIEVDITNKNTRVSPSRYALSAVTQLVKNDSSSLSDKGVTGESQAQTVAKKKKYLCGYIVDCFIKQVPKK